MSWLAWSVPDHRLVTQATSPKELRLACSVGVVRFDNLTPVSELVFLNFPALGWSDWHEHLVS
ncbi:hypothetical protein TIFTF001_008138 [Ficus carica]|uniref:Uncharacterized protein n=1 Tax=Ficus carica TaxID=3494 RepID=A0AA88CXQ9_FICCA|nr:hypothetical protein TIFTF001_008138 [Ficus carica]